MPVCDDCDLKNEAQAVTGRPIAWQGQFDVVLILELLYDIRQVVFLDLAFGAHLVFNGRLVVLVERFKASKDPIELLVLALLVAHLDAVWRPLDALVCHRDLLQRAAVPLHE